MQIQMPQKLMYKILINSKFINQKFRPVLILVSIARQKEELSCAHRTRLEGGDIALRWVIKLPHAIPHVRIAGEVEILHQHSLGAFSDGSRQFNGRLGHLHVRLCREGSLRDEVPEYHLLVPHALPILTLHPPFSFLFFSFLATECVKGPRS